VIERDHVGLSVEIELRDRDLRIELEVQAGETMALLGPNGAGKSSVLAVAAGLLRPDTGHVTVDGRTVVGDGVWVPPHARGVALLAQDALLFPHLSALDNVAFGPRSRKLGRHAAREQAERWLDRVGAAEHAARRPAQLSGGQQQRVAIARALAAEPHLLLLDEPMAALDVTVVPSVRRVLSDVLRDRTTVMVTHDVIDAMTLADRVAVIENGRVVEQGTTRDVLTSPRSGFAADIAGLNLVVGRWQGGQVVDGTIRMTGHLVEDEPAEDDPVVAVCDPASVAVLRSPPDGSPRNVFSAIVHDLEPRGQLVRVHTDRLAADVTLAAAADLSLQPGSEVVLSVKAAEVRVLRR